MNWKSQLRKPNIQQGILEVIFPLVGYFFWDWSLIIIITFYLIDFSASQIMFTRRLVKVKNQLNESLDWLVPVSISVSLIYTVLIVLSIYVAISQSQNPLLLSTMLKDIKFFALDELWYLFPVILLSSYMMDKVQFYTPKQYLNYIPRTYLISNIKLNGLALLLVIIGSLFFSFFNPSILVSVICIVVVKLIFDSFKNYIVKL